MSAGAAELIAEVVELAQRAPWKDEVQDREGAVLLAAGGETERARVAAAAHPARPSEEVVAAAGLSQAELLLARALGGQWLDHYIAVTRHVRPVISGQDLVDAGIDPGPAIGRGLDEAFRALLDGEATSREEQLAAALRAAGQTER